MEQVTGNIEAVVDQSHADKGEETDQKGAECSASGDVASQQLGTEEIVENEQLDGSMAVVPPPLEQMDPQVPDVYGVSPVASVQSGVSGEMEEQFGSPSFEEPLTPATDNSSTSKSQPGSGRVTPASQSDQSLYMSSSEKGTPMRKRKLTDSGVRQIDFDNQSSSSGSIRNVRFPFRAGISWRKGERLEAMDFMHKWFPAKIRDINEEDLTVLIHFDGWNQRFDEWVDMASDRIRPLMRHSERKEKLRRLKAISDYKIGEQVYAKWTDCKMYPAKVTGVLSNGSYEVIFYDGFKKQVQPINLRPMAGEMKSKAFEVSPVTAGVPKKQKTRRESGAVTSPTDTRTMSSPPGLKVKKEPRSRSRSTGKQRSRKNKVIPMEQFVSKEVLFKDDGTGPTEGAGHVLKSEPVSTQTEYAEPKVVEIKQEPSTPEPIPTPIVTVRESLPAETAYAKPTVHEKAPLHGPPVLPPKAFVVEPDHNHYKCHFENCNKGFRKEHLLEYHIKYYHIDGAEAPPLQPQKRRRKTTSFCSTESDSTPSTKKSGSKKPRHSSAENLPAQEIKQEVKEEIDDAALLLLIGRPKQETGEISTQTTLVKQEAEDDSLTADVESLHQRTMSQDSVLTEESSVTDVEDFLKPDELVNCICDYYEENGLMIQCEVCLCWQHASCFGITERTLPKTYVCFVCENPPGVRESSRYVHEQDWFKCGEMAAFNYLPNINATEERCNSIKQTHSLMAEMHQLNTVLHSLKLQLKILRSKDEQKLKLWRMDWDITETFQDDDDNDLTHGNATGRDEKIADQGTSAAEAPDESAKVVFTLSAADDVENEVTVANETESRTAADNKEDSGKLGTREDEVKPETEGGATEGTRGMATVDGVDTSKAGSQDKKDETTAMTATEMANQMMSPAREEKDQEEGTHSDSTESVVEDPIEMYERNLLNHIQRVQIEIDNRMDKIEEQVTILEGMEAMGSRRGPSSTDDVTADMPHLKRTMRTLHNDLYKVKKMAVFH